MLKYLESISYRDTNQFPKLFLDYIDQKENLKDFFNYSPDLGGFEKLIKERKDFSSEKRELLKRHFQMQYDGIEICDAVKRNINSISQGNTFTVTTGHQLNLFTGPLYFIYKILTVINLSELLKKKFPGNNFIPVYWMASEDHDFEEIHYFNFSGKKYSWDTDQKGAVGRFTTKNIGEYLKSLPLSDEYKSFYSESYSLGEAHLKLTNHLFSEYGLLVLDADAQELKTSFNEVISKDIQGQVSYEKTEKTSDSLASLGYNTPVNPRRINYFYLDKNLRERIEVNQQDYFFTSENKIRNLDIKTLLSEEPEKVSPNVITRPIYQEFILPNLAYIGGPSELSYWLQLKSTFDTLGIRFPLLIPRYSSSILSEKAISKIKDIGIDDLQMLFEEDREVLKKLLIKNNLLDTEQHQNWSEEVEILFKRIKLAAEKKDKTLGPSVEARKKKVLKELDKIRKKMETAEIRNQEILKNRFYYAKDELFPNGNFQERNNNIMEYLLEDENFISNLKEEMQDPLEFSHSIFKT